MNIKPLGDRVVILPLSDTKEGKTKSGLYLPDTASKERPEKGEIIAVGPGKMDDAGKRMPIGLKRGDVVLFTKYGPQEIKIDGKEYLIAREDDVIAIVE
ncbi:MAG: co-chaperone GroES [Candidatus Sungbacteria bacterium]|uniref:Co-chaperonin GroES n=1 Tax=Candidatus Sungiibacteriota bacterium TaxID=2750080 RepID=A0A9D6QTM3_9BACT|nr:co-chaperone GroES [Candidatus Sungbacteria bacterium]